MAVILAMAAMSAWAITTGRLSYVVTHGVSMHPEYYAGDLVILLKTDSYEVGQIAAYHGSGGRVEVLHRIVGGDENGFVFKGDNNTSIDAYEPRADELIGRAVLHVPKVGSWVQPMLSPTGLGMLGFLFVGGGTVAVKSRRDLPRGRRKKRAKGMSGGGGSLATAAVVIKAISRLHPALRALAVVAALCAVLGVVLGVLGWIKPVTEAVPAAGGRAGDSMTFSYSAEVPRSAAYDGTRAESPDPIFRKLAEVVDLHLAYRGEPGRIEVIVRLSSQNGWHSTVPLSQPRSFTSDHFADVVQLDLKALEKRAVDAEKATGAGMGEVAVTVTARVRHRDGSQFEPQLPLKLTPLQLTLAGDPRTLVVDASTAPAGASLRLRQISALGRDLLTAEQARSYAVYLLVVAVAGAAVVAMLALRHVPLRTRAQIQRRYPHLLVPVEPMPSPPGKPVVVVDTFPALVKLAERYGQMILTWTRPDGADDFVVRDEGIVYRYRIAPEQPRIGSAPLVGESAVERVGEPAAERRPSEATQVAGAYPAAALPAAPAPGAGTPPGPAELEAPPPESSTGPKPAKRARRPRSKADSDGPVDPAASSTPTSSAGPTGSAGPVTPAEPDAPIEAISSAGPTASSEPATSAAPDSSIEPTEPAGPAIPAEPVEKVTPSGAEPAGTAKAVKPKRTARPRTRKPAAVPETADSPAPPSEADAGAGEEVTAAGPPARAPKEASAERPPTPEPSTAEGTIPGDTPTSEPSVSDAPAGTFASVDTPAATAATDTTATDTTDQPAAGMPGHDARPPVSGVTPPVSGTAERERENAEPAAPGSEERPAAPEAAAAEPAGPETASAGSADTGTPADPSENRAAQRSPTRKPRARKTTKPPATEPEAVEPSATEPEAARPPAAESEATKAPGTEPEATEPEAARTPALVEREAMEDLARINETVGATSDTTDAATDRLDATSAPADTPFLAFLPPSKRPPPHR